MFTAIGHVNLYKNTCSSPQSVKGNILWMSGSYGRIVVGKAHGYRNSQLGAVPSLICLQVSHLTTRLLAAGYFMTDIMLGH